VNPKFKIAMIAPCPLPYPRGTPIRIYKMAHALAEQGCDVHLITYHLGDKLTKKNNSVALKFHRTPFIPTYKKLSPGPSYQKLLILDFLLLLKLSNVLKKYKIDIIHAHHYESLLVSFLTKIWSKYPVVYDAHTLLGSELHYYNLGLPGQLKKFIGCLFDSQLPKRADYVLSVTESIRDKLINSGNVNPDNISVIMNGVEIQHFISQKEIDNFDDSVKKLVYTGNLGDFQGIDHLLNIFAYVLKLREDVRLQIVTNDSFKNYQNLANKLGIMPFIDIIESDFAKLPAMLHSSHIALNPRIECDGIPQKLLNYMAAGKPIVSFKGSAKILKHNETGYVVENKNYEDFAKAVVYLLDNYRTAKKIGENAQKIINQNFTWESKSNEIINIYEKVLKKFHSYPFG
jgi:glycosyltransferase involved in cell wall biosynthesis